MNKHSFAAVAALGLSSFALPAPALDVGGVIYLNIDSGGDTLIETSEGDVTGGGLVHLAGGLAFKGYAGDNLETQFTFGMKADSVSGSNGSASFYRWPLELTQFYRDGRFRAGAGLTYHMNPEADCDIDHWEAGCDFTVRFDDALGYVLQADYVMELETAVREITIGGRYTSIDYEVSATGEKFDGNSVGLSLGLGF